MGSRFLCAGLLLAAWLVWRRAPMPAWRQAPQLRRWRCSCLSVEWPDRALPSRPSLPARPTVTDRLDADLGLSLECVLGTRPRCGEGLAIAIGSAGILVLTAGAEFRVSTTGVLALLPAVASWSFGSQLARRLELPEGPPHLPRRC
ncbi:hypothetical protein ACTMU2_17020 [Cupriavidus basilensis]